VIRVRRIRFLKKKKKTRVNCERLAPHSKPNAPHALTPDRRTRTSYLSSRSDWKDDGRSAIVFWSVSLGQHELRPRSAAPVRHRRPLVEPQDAAKRLTTATGLFREGLCFAGVQYGFVNGNGATISFRGLHRSA